MSKFLFPTEFYDSAYSIDFEKYYRLGYKGIIFDIDNTLVPHNAKHDDRSLQLFKELKEMGFKICFVSNNKESRVKSFNDQVDCNYIFKAGKPKKSGFIEAMNKIHTNTENTIFIGDQIYTDIWGANNAGIHSILVKQIDKKEEIQIVLKRIIEKPVIWIWINIFHHRMKTKKLT
ncbi:MAG: YqeG family HAD IIIA-type phosphatase [Eubacterium sp.]|nr:YqeG family HAD IIIA-type phosphatase [Eubacterium sp.]